MQVLSSTSAIATDTLALSDDKQCQWELGETTDEEGSSTLIEVRSDGDSTDQEEDDSASELPQGDRFPECEAVFYAPPGLASAPPGLSSTCGPPGLALSPELATDSLASCETSLLSSLSSLSSTSTPRFDRSNNIIFLDWDDTICPTTVCGERVPYGSDADGSGGGAEPCPVSIEELNLLKPALADVARVAARVLAHACELAATVVIVTNAGEGWVEWSCAQWLPELLPALEKVEVVSARSAWEPHGITEPTAWKELTFRELLMRSKFHIPSESVKHIVCVGDAPYEHDAMNRVLISYSEDGNFNCRCKSIKFMPQPTVECIARELQMLDTNLENLVNQREDLFEVYLTETI